MVTSVRVESGVDRISALPDDLLGHILSFLPTIMAIRTSVLSSRWRFLYYLISSMDIDTDLRNRLPEKSCQFLNFVEGLLLGHNRQSIQRFHLEWRHYIDPLQTNRWICALMCRKIRELELCKWYGLLEVMQLPSSLFFCETLVVLKLVVGLASAASDSLKLPAETSLPNLKVLHIRRSAILGDHFEKLLSSCPVLDDLVLDSCRLFTRSDSFKLNISNATLRRLTMRLSSSLQSGKAFEIVVNSPALVYLNYALVDKQSLMLLAKQSLAEVVISGYSSGEIGRKYLNASYAMAQKRDVLKGINNIQSLQILDYALQGLRYHDLHLPLFNKLTQLIITDSTFIYDARFLEYILAQCVVLETLIFVEHKELHWSVARGGRVPFFVEQSRLTGVLCHLKVFRIMLFKIGDSEAEALMELIEFFLNNANALKELTILVKKFQIPHTKQMDMVRESLTTLPRVSEKCSVFCGKWRSPRR